MTLLLAHNACRKVGQAVDFDKRILRFGPGDIYQIFSRLFQDLSNHHSHSKLSEKLPACCSQHRFYTPLHQINFSSTEDEAVGIIIDPRLGPSWSAAVEHQLSLELGSLRSKIVSLKTRLDTVVEGDTRQLAADIENKKLQYRCTIDADLAVGGNVTVVMMNSDPKVCIADTAARLRRTVARKLKRRTFSETTAPAQPM